MRVTIATVRPEDASFLVNVAVIGATLLALTFVALSVFIVELMRRHESLGVPVFRDKKGEDRKPGALESLTDKELLDGDPLVTFIAFSAAVSWNLFLMPIILGLTGAWGAPKPLAFAMELGVFAALFLYTGIIRSRRLNELNPYRTGEERAWPAFAILALAILVATVGTSMASVIMGPTMEDWAIFSIKFVCILSLALGTYNVNKDMFIFLKAVAAERMRRRWLEHFVIDRYPRLKASVREALALDLPVSNEGQVLAAVWNDGYPPVEPEHAALKGWGKDAVAQIWDEISLRGAGGAAWMLDVPGIADWAHRVESSLLQYNRFTHGLNATQALSMKGM